MRTFLGQGSTSVEDELAARRVEVARGNSRWTEIAPAERLRQRELGLLVDSETDLVWTRRPGMVWAPETAHVEYVDPRSEQTFYVDSAGEVVFLESVQMTWSEHVRRAAR